QQPGHYQAGGAGELGSERHGAGELDPPVPSLQRRAGSGGLPGGEGTLRAGGALFGRARLGRVLPRSVLPTGVLVGIALPCGGFLSGGLLRRPTGACLVLHLVGVRAGYLVACRRTTIVTIALART